MAKTGIRVIGIDHAAPVAGDKPIAFLWGLPMNYAEACAFSAYEGGVWTANDHEILMAWVVKMTLVHGTWVGERLVFLQN
jgi:hypothetical protein